MTRYQPWTRPPRALRGHQVNLDNLALVPASELASLAEWQRRARALPDGETLLVIPSGNERLQAVGRQVQRSQSQRGRRTVIALVSSNPPA
jgi:hypothetical protein